MDLLFKFASKTLKLSSTIFGTALAWRFDQLFVEWLYLG
jgi:hypothetical protein